MYPPESYHRQVIDDIYRKVRWLRIAGPLMALLGPLGFIPTTLFVTDATTAGLAGGVCGIVTGVGLLWVIMGSRWFVRWNYNSIWRR